MMRFFAGMVGENMGKMKKADMARMAGGVMILLSAVILTAPSPAISAEKKAAAQPAARKASAPPPAPIAPDAHSVQIVDFSEAFEEKYGKGAADSIEFVIRNDYLKCTGDTTFISRARLFEWKNRIDTTILADKEYKKKFDTFIRSTGIKAHEVRPCEPLVFYEKLDTQLKEMDSIVNAERARREKAAKDSALLAKELGANKARPADIFGIPAGVSKNVVKIILSNNKINSRNVNNWVQADSVTIDSLIVTVAFHFDAAGKYNGYELETAALKAAELDKTVRGWADRLSDHYEKKLGPPTRRSRVGFHDIKQGRLSVTSRWNKDDAKTVAGLATHNNLYYAKVIVDYGK